MAHRRRIGAGEFKATCLKLMDEVQEQHIEYVITKHGKPVAKLVSAKEAPKAFGCLKGTVTIMRDIVTPTNKDWYAEK